MVERLKTRNAKTYEYSDTVSTFEKSFRQTYG